MAEQHEEGGLIKTPKQLVIAVVLGLAIPVGLAVMMSQLVTTGQSGKDAPEEAVLKRIQPVAKVELAGAAGGAKGAKSSEEVYKTTCAACHDSGAAGAPKLGDKAAWAARIGVGLEKLAQSGIKGKNAMPPKGGNASIPDADIRAAVEYMATAAK